MGGVEKFLRDEIIFLVVEIVEEFCHVDAHVAILAPTYSPHLQSIDIKGLAKFRPSEGKQNEHLQGTFFRPTPKRRNGEAFPCLPTP
jgi:hypothetical protein